MPRRTRSVKGRAAFINSLHRAPIGAPSKPQRKVQILARATPRDLTSVDTPLSLSPTDSEIASSMGPGDFSLPLSRRGRILDDNGPPRSSAPVSLEDLVVKGKPGRNKGNRSLKTVGSLIAEGADSSHDSLGSHEMATIADESPTRFTSPAQLPEAVPLQSLPRQPQTESALAALDASFEDGAFHRKTLDNGDISIFQWTAAHQQWIHLGQIDQGDVSLFTRFYDRAYSDNHSNVENWKLYKEHIVATVKQLSQKRRESSTTDKASKAIAGPLSNPKLRSNHEHLPTRYANPVSEETESFPPLPTRRLLVPDADSNGTLNRLGISRTSQGLDQHAHSQHMLERSFDSHIDFHSRPSQSVRRVSTQQDASADEIRGREEYRDLERRRIQHNLLLQYHRSNALKQQQQQQQQQQRSVSNFLPSELDQLFRQPKLYGDLVAPPRSSSNSQDLRRTVLHDPLKAALSLSDAKQDQKAVRAIGHGAPRSSEIYTRDSGFFAGSTELPNTLRDLVGMSEPVKSPAREVKFFVRSDGDPALDAGLTLNKSDDSLRAQKLKRRFFSQDGKDLHSTLSYEESLQQFWTSGLKRQSGYERQADKILARNNENFDTEAQIGVRALMPVYESIAGYQFSKNVRAAGGQDYFANFTEPPKWCVDRGGATSGKPASLFEDQDWTDIPSILQKNTRHPRAPLVGGNRSLGTLGLGFRLPPLSSYGRSSQAYLGVNGEDLRDEKEGL